MPILTWLDRPKTLTTVSKVPCRILRVNERLSCGDKDSGNLLVQGDNLHALKALLPYFRGQVKCIFIDPPYNTKSAFEHYQDSLEHSKWLDMMYPRLELLRELLAEDGSIWVTIDDNEAHYLKVIMDEIFGRGNFVASNIWQKRYSRENREAIGDAHDYVILYAKNPEKFKAARNLVPITEEQAKIYKNPNNHPRGRWRAIPMTAQGYRPNQMYTIIAPGGAVHVPPEGRCWSTIEPEFKKLLAEGRIYFGKDGNSQPNIIRFLDEVKGMVPWTWWPHDEAGHNDEAKKEMQVLFGKSDVFATPKPERLIKRVLEIATNPGDLVLDSFLGSGTTAAVAHKMQRRYIGIELGEHARTHCAVRLQKVIQGEQGGISKAVNWQGGGGFRFYTLGAELFGADGNIHPEVKFADLAAYLWFMQTHTPYKGKADSPLLGIHNETAYYLLYNGILKDKSIDGGNVLTRPLLQTLPAHTGKRVIYANSSRLGEKALQAANVIFQPIPWAIQADGMHAGSRKR